METSGHTYVIIVFNLSDDGILFNRMYCIPGFKSKWTTRILYMVSFDFEWCCFVTFIANLATKVQCIAKCIKFIKFSAVLFQCR